MLKRILKISILLFLVLLINSDNFIYCNAENFDFNGDVDIYSIYDEQFNLLFQKDEVVVGDGYLSNDSKYYEVVYIDKDNKTGLAKFVRDVSIPKVDISNGPIPIKIERRVICMYMTHNDESYVPSDGVDSIYGNGGIKDVAVALKTQLEKYFVDVHLDDTLHIPHDNSAYSRSLKTAKSLINTYKPDAIFDIHRDATRRSFYVTNVDGQERGRVRIVLGKSNPEMAVNEEFALYLVAVAKEMYPWLFTDIFYASGHYNQSLDGKSILFEMGSHLVEKELEIASMTELADVIVTALYNTTVNENTGDLTINGVEDSQNTIVNEYISKKDGVSINILALCVTIVIFAAICVYASYMFFKNLKNLSVKVDNTRKK